MGSSAFGVAHRVSRPRVAASSIRSFASSFSRGSLRRSTSAVATPDAWRKDIALTLGRKTELSGRQIAERVGMPQPTVARWLEDASHVSGGIARTHASAAPYGARSVAPPSASTVNWSGLTPRGREILRQIGFRLAAGYSYAETAAMIEASREGVRADLLPLPRKVSNQSGA
jgi:DNA-binding CsgD family transcriptional regulator